MARSLNVVCILLIIAAGIERISFKGLSSNLISYLTDELHISYSWAVKFAHIWVGVTWSFPILITFFGDTYFPNKYWTIFGSCLLYALSLLIMAFTSIVKVPSLIVSTMALFTISFCQAGFSNSLQALGARQLENEEDDLREEVQNKYFSWHYFASCCGNVLGVLMVSCIVETYGWSVVFIILTITMLEVQLLFGIMNRCCNLRGCITDNVSSHDGYIIIESEPQVTSTTPLQALNAAIPLIPVWLVLVVFAVIFQQPTTFFTKQGLSMKRDIGGFKIPPAALQTTVTITIIVLLPLYERLFIPLVRRFSRNEQGITLKNRIGIGMLLSVIAMINAGVIERKRHQNMLQPISIFWLLPQYILIGISDIFTVVGASQYFYSRVPRGMGITGLALNSSVYGVGNFLSTIIISGIEYTMGDDFFESHLDKYYWFLAFLSFTSFLAFLNVCKFSRM